MKDFVTAKERLNFTNPLLQKLIIISGWLLTASYVALCFTG